MYDYICISDESLIKCPNTWTGIKCSPPYYKTKKVYEDIVKSNNINGIKYVFFGLKNNIKAIADFMLYCDFYRFQYPQIIGISNLPEKHYSSILDALYQRGYREKTPIPEQFSHANILLVHILSQINFKLPE